MIPSRQPWSTPTTPSTPYNPEPHATREEIDRCTSCQFPPETCEICTLHLDCRDLRDLERRIAYLVHQIVNKPVYRAVAAIRKELGR